MNLRPGCSAEDAPPGDLDLTFSSDGKQRTNFGGDDSASGVALQTDGRILAAGSGLGPSQTTDFALARYLGVEPRTG